MNALRSTLARSFSDLFGLLEPWTTAFDAVASGRAISVSPDWCYGLWFQHSGVAEIEILAVWRGDALALVFPYRLERSGLGRVAIEGLLEIEPVFAADDGDEAVFDHLLATLARIHRRASIGLTQADPRYCSTRSLVDAARRAGLGLRMTPSHDNVMISLAGGFESFRAGLSRNTREGLRKARARLARDARSHRFVTASEPTEVARAIDLSLSVDARSWKVARGGAMCESAKEDVMFKCALERMAHKQRARVYVLEIDRRPAAFILGSALGSTAFMSIWTHAEDLRHFTPGKLVMAYALRELAAECVVTVDTWGRWDRFKAGWSSATIPRYRVEIARATERSRPWPAARARFHRWFAGDSLRSRLRTDEPSPFERRILETLGRGLGAVITLLTLPGVPSFGRTPATRGQVLRVRRPAELDGVRLGFAVDVERGWVIEREGQVVGYAELRVFFGGRILRFDTLRVEGGALEARAALDQVLREYPCARWIAEPSSAGALSGELSVRELLGDGRS